MSDFTPPPFPPRSIPIGISFELGAGGFDHPPRGVEGNLVLALPTDELVDHLGGRVVDVGDGLGQFKVKPGDVIVGKSITWL